MCEEQCLSKITVTALVRESGTARQTFYNHFRDINDLVSYIPISYLLSDDDLPINTVENVRHAFVFAQAHKGFFRQLPEHSGQNNFRDTIVQWLQGLSYEHYVDDTLSDDKQLLQKLTIDVYVYGIVDVFLQWCSSGLEWPFEVVLEAVWDTAPNFLREQPILALDTSRKRELVGVSL